jgi:hypothetical protein
MIALRKRVYIDNCAGMCNRLEIYVLAYAIRRAFGHEIVLGWPELDALRIEGTRRGNPGLWGRWGAVRVRICSEELFRSLARRRKIILRGVAGPEETRQSVYREATSKVSLQPALANIVAETFKKTGNRPVVGIHLRQGDYPLLDNDIYDLRQATLCAVPVWWHEWIMRAIVKRQPDTCFLLCHNGSPEPAALLKKNFDIIELPIRNTYQKSVGHQSVHHPVADLFALACCPVVLATPVSSFSHYAVNVLGPESICLLPPPQMTKANPAVARLQLYQRLLDHWVNGCLTVPDTLSPSLANIELGQPAQYQWLERNAHAC